ncbi:MAG: hypothetical protein FWK04_28200 [Nostoc sp. GBBB01]|uniref:Secreted protein n=1 Tax=Nostoc punctiforme FACHB-252 TaxID=1357509 RepID=A0ABR8HD86_NOSPU|nr:hypothetical protein [Nostoc punctiforme]MBD2613646.1 hypothetical protein [Nostoc punctiforme FACHB-252]MBL1202843.1 hypothetical protein [Nostoc sp. GBBB01]MDZ8012570.1 hypothetical protein [Nostoc sp. ZfuVER08]
MLRIHLLALVWWFVEEPTHCHNYNSFVFPTVLNMSFRCEHYMGQALMDECPKILQSKLASIAVSAL